ncbi:unnamed protein product [Ilex paraguariensis]|uniref:Uncharacterized protein n=1 Tax=Ilex paraguariensis TaxID=185542 RepID=A0ABC8R863_9AQUA
MALNSVSLPGCRKSLWNCRVNLWRFKPSWLSKTIEEVLLPEELCVVVAALLGFSGLAMLWCCQNFGGGCELLIASQLLIAFRASCQ